MIIDSHCHLDNEKLQPRIKDIINSASKSNVKYMLTICTDNLSFTKIINILNAYENVFGTYGIHPHETSKYKNLTIDKIKKQLLKHDKVIGVGESGLDFYYNHSDKNIQKSLFIKHIQSCQETSKPLIVHSRNAEKETLEILTSEKKNRNFDVPTFFACFSFFGIFGFFGPETLKIKSPMRFRAYWGAESSGGMVSNRCFDKLRENLVHRTFWLLTILLSGPIHIAERA